MNGFIIAALLLAGPYVEPQHAIAIKIHLGIDHRSRIARQELTCGSPYFFENLLRVRNLYRLEVDDDEYDSPTYQIGRCDYRRQFPAGTFICSGSFVRTLRSIAEVDHWERELPDVVWIAGPGHEYECYRKQDAKPEVFP